MSTTIFWVCLLFILYTYIGYPLIIWMLSKTRTKVTVIIEGYENWPDISIVVPVYNEVPNIRKKIENLESLNYPKDKVQIIFVSDGSTDNTNEFLSSYKNIKFISYEKRQGKPTALNTAVENISTEIIVFTDVRQKLDKNAVKYLIKRLMIPGIGAVSGELCHEESTTNIGKNVGIYWLYEKWIRKSESRFSSTAGVTGALYAIHKKNYRMLRKDTLLDDFEIPIHIIKMKLRVVLESQAKLYDQSQEDILGEKKRKVRTLTGNFQSYMWNLWLFIPWINPILFQFLSHKVFRLIVPYAMFLQLVSSLISHGVFYTFIFWFQVLFYSLGFSGMYSDSIRKIKLISIIVVFIELNVAAVLALKQFVSGKVNVRWDKT